MIKNPKHILVLAITWVLPILVYCQTDITGGTVKGTWTRAASPYIIKGAVEVMPNTSLVIEAGVLVEFEDATYLTVGGSIKALGTSTDPVKFTARDTSKGWLGLRIKGTSASIDSSSFQHCEFSYAKQLTPDVWSNFGAVLLDSAHFVRFENCEFKKNKSFVYACIKSSFSEVEVKNCLFRDNMAMDTNATHPNNTDGPFGSCIGSRYSEFDITSSQFTDNHSIAPNYSDRDVRYRAGGMLSFLGNSVRISDCEIQGNSAENGYLVQYKSYDLDHLKKDSFHFMNNEVRENVINDNDILRIDGSYHQYLWAMVQHCRFIENSCGELSKGSVLNCYNSNGSLSQVMIDQCDFINNQMKRAVLMFADAKVSLSNSRIHGQSGTGVEVRQTGLSHMTNCILSNNWMGVESAFNADFSVVNSVVAYNGRLDTTAPYLEALSVKPYHVSGGVYVSDRGKINIYNSIVSNNQGHLGQMANLFAINRTIFSGKIQNSIVEGGLDSSYRQPVDNPWIPTGSVPTTAYVHVTESTPSYLNPPTAVGVKSWNESIHLQIKESCDTSQVIDKGLNFIIGLPINVWPNGKDITGNERIRCNTMDIGPFEVSGNKGFTALVSPWQDKTLCSNELESFNPDVCGYDVQYIWQTSADKKAWNNLGSSAFDGNRLINPKSGYYRVIAKQQECNVVDTFGVAKLSVLESPSPDLGNDTTIRVTDTLWLSPGKFQSYTWNIPGGNTSEVAFIGKQYVALKKKLVWVEVVGTNGCRNRDSITISIKDANASLKNMNIPTGILVYPNPFNHCVRIASKNALPIDVEIYDLSGHLMHRCANVESEHINLTGLPKGVYILNAKSNSSYYQTRIVKLNNP